MDCVSYLHRKQFIVPSFNIFKVHNNIEYIIRLNYILAFGINNKAGFFELIANAKSEIGGYIVYVFIMLLLDIFYYFIIDIT